MSNKFENQLKDLSIELNESQKQQFEKYYEMLVEWNKVMNLTGITEHDEVNEKHFIDSLAIVKDGRYPKGTFCDRYRYRCGIPGTST